jgi:hypothetical protein
VAIVIDTPKAAQEVQGLPFCYLCCQPLGADGRPTPDHVPPKRLFAKAHRDFPLVLPAHAACNVARSQHDQMMCQLVGPLRGRPPDPQHQKIKVVSGTFPDGTPGVAVADMNLRAIIARWLRAFHAALYREALPADAHFSIYPPFPETRGTPDALQIVPIPDAFRHFVTELKRNRAADRLDRIVTRKGHCRYECVWTEADDRKAICVFGLDIYSWSRLGDGLHFEPRGCVGAYWPDDRHVPEHAARATIVEVLFANRSPLDPFGE